MRLNGLHHVSSITGDAKYNVDFHTRLLGMRLVKKTVNQDDVSAYHLFYADALGSAGTELTFFDWPSVPRSRIGAGAVTETALRVGGGAESLNLWAGWFDKNKVAHGEIENGSLAFQDAEGQRLRLVAEADAGGHPWRESPVPLHAAIFGLSNVTLTVEEREPTARFLTGVLGFRESESSLFETGEGGPGAQLRLLVSPNRGAPGAGGVHHVAWAVRDAETQQAWLDHLAEHLVPNSGLIDRFYFQSVYFRVPGGILFEIATEGPGFTADGEDVDHLGERLSLPPFLEKNRVRIEAGLKPL